MKKILFALAICFTAMTSFAPRNAAANEAKEEIFCLIPVYEVIQYSCGDVIAMVWHIDGICGTYVVNYWPGGEVGVCTHDHDAPPYP